MAGWISSKLKVAENFLQQIDQQAAESLRKSEGPQSDNVPIDETPARTESIPLKDQLKKKVPDRIRPYGDLRRDDSDTDGRWKKVDAVEQPDPISVGKSNSNFSPPAAAAATAADGDWTELLGSSDPSMPTKRQRAARDHKKNGIGVLSPLMEGKRSISKAGTKSHVSPNYKAGLDSSDVDRKRTDEEFGLSGGSDSSDSTKRKPNQESQATDGNILLEPKQNGNGDLMISETLEKRRQSHLGNVIRAEEDLVAVSLSVTADGIYDSKRQVDGSSVNSRDGDVGILTHSVPKDLPSSSGSDGRSDSDSDSGSSSDSENDNERREKRRKRHERILAEEAAAKAVEAIKERENMVARLEGEKQSLEKILEEREKQQAQEASELQINMTETMEAVELEKQKHNSTRMEVLARLAKLETTNAELARSLASTQRNLEVEVDRCVELKQEIELKEVAHEELRRKISNANQSASSLTQKRASKGVEFEREILEAEYSVISDKIRQLQVKAKKLEENIEMTRKQMEDPTEVEIELKKQLAQLTDRLIQKQVQVESLASEKATLLFRLETVSRLLDESKLSSQLADLAGSSARDDLEAGIWEPCTLRLRPIRYGRKQLGSVLQQLDAIFSAGAVFLRGNPAAKKWALIYLVCLHLWVTYIFMSHSQASDEIGSGAVVSLEGINQTGV